MNKQIVKITAIAILSLFLHGCSTEVGNEEVSDQYTIEEIVQSESESNDKKTNDSIDEINIDLQISHTVSGDEYDRYFKAIHNLKQLDSQLHFYYQEPLGPASWKQFMIKEPVNINNTTPNVKYLNLMGDWISEVKANLTVIKRLSNEKTAISQVQYDQLIQELRELQSLLPYIEENLLFSEDYLHWITSLDDMSIKRIYNDCSNLTVVTSDRGEINWADLQPSDLTNTGAKTKEELCEQTLQHDDISVIKDMHQSQLEKVQDALESIGKVASIYGPNASLKVEEERTQNEIVVSRTYDNIHTLVDELKAFEKEQLQILANKGDKYVEILLPKITNGATNSGEGNPMATSLYMFDTIYTGTNQIKERLNIGKEIHSRYKEEVFYESAMKQMARKDKKFKTIVEKYEKDETVLLREHGKLFLKDLASNGVEALWQLSIAEYYHQELFLPLFEDEEKAWDLAKEMASIYTTDPVAATTAYGRLVHKLMMYTFDELHKIVDEMNPNASAMFRNEERSRLTINIVVDHATTYIHMISDGKDPKQIGKTMGKMFEDASDVYNYKVVIPNEFTVFHYPDPKSSFEKAKEKVSQFFSSNGKKENNELSNDGSGSLEDYQDFLNERIQEVFDYLETSP